MPRSPWGLQDDFRKELARAGSLSFAGSRPLAIAPQQGGGRNARGRAQAVLDSISGGDAALLVGGDLTVMVVQVGRFPNSLPRSQRLYWQFMQVFVEAIQ